jgi:hypothetical protein
MQRNRPTREERRQQLRQMLQTPRGRQQVEQLFFACFEPGVMPPVGLFQIETILNHEYGPEA